MTARRIPCTGYTLVEILMVIVIISIISTLALPTFTYVKAKAQNAVCVANLRSIHTTLVVYMQDHDTTWPQEPEGMDDDVQVSKWWFEALKGYGLPRKSWICPMEEAARDSRDPLFQNGTFVSSYLVTRFDNLPNLPYLWHQPWVREKFENHNKQGPNMVMPDGTVHPGMALLGR